MSMGERLPVCYPTDGISMHRQTDSFLSASEPIAALSDIQHSFYVMVKDVELD